MPDRRLAASFAVGGSSYDRVRPGYPRDAVRFCAGPARRVADVGAGTGKLTRTLVELGLDVVAVEPSASMREALHAALPDVEVRDGTGEATGLEAASVDLAVFAQSWHWVDPVAGGAELARILRLGGAVSMLWNGLDTQVPWVDRLQEAMHDTPLAWDRHGGGERFAGPGERFGPMAELQVRWEQPITLADLAGLAQTRSYYLASDAAERTAHSARVRATVAELFPAKAWDDVVGLPYVTDARRYALLP